MAADQPKPTHALSYLLRQLLLNFLPTVFLGILGLLLDEAAGLVTQVACYFRPTPSPQVAIASSASSAAADCSQLPLPPTVLPPSSPENVKQRSVRSDLLRSDTESVVSLFTSSSAPLPTENASALLPGEARAKEVLTETTSEIQTSSEIPNVSLHETTALIVASQTKSDSSSSETSELTTIEESARVSPVETGPSGLPNEATSDALRTETDLDVSTDEETLDVSQSETTSDVPPSETIAVASPRESTSNVPSELNADSMPTETALTALSAETKQDVSTNEDMSDLPLTEETSDVSLTETASAVSKCEGGPDVSTIEVVPKTSPDAFASETVPVISAKAFTSECIPVTSIEAVASEGLPGPSLKAFASESNHAPPFKAFDSGCTPLPSVIALASSSQDVTAIPSRQILISIPPPPSHPPPPPLVRSRLIPPPPPYRPRSRNQFLEQSQSKNIPSPPHSPKPPPSSPQSHPSTPKLQFQSSLVARRIDAYETFLVSTEAETRAPLRLPLPASPPRSCPPSERTADASPLLSSTHASLVGPGSPDCSSSFSRLDFCLETSTDNPIFADHDEGDTVRTHQEAVVLPSPPPLTRTEERRTSVSNNHAQVSAKKLSIKLSEAPAGVDCLQELIPERRYSKSKRGSAPVVKESVPTVDPQLFPTDECPVEMPELALDDVAVVNVESMERFPFFEKGLPGSNTSLKTESYSSPESPKSPVVSSPSQGSSSQIRHRESWRASDHDLFSEDPLMVCDDIDENQLANGRRFRRKGSSSVSESGGVNPHLAAEYDSTKLLSGSRHRRSSSEDNLLNASTPVTDQSDSSWQKRFVQVDSVADRRKPAGTSKNKRRPDNRLFRQASLDVTALKSQVSDDRPRAGRGSSWSIMNRFTPSQLSSRPSAMVRGDRNVPGIMSKRSVSTNGHGFEDWPEYAPSLAQENAKLSRRHMSDMSFGVKDRKIAMLPDELVRDELQGDHNLPERFGGTGRNNRKWLGVPTIPKESSDARPRGVLNNILRRRRKGSTLDAAFENMTSTHGSIHRGDTALRRSGRDRDFKFELSMSQETVFSLLHRICPSCGFRISIVRARYKLKIEIPSDGLNRPLLASIVLTSMSHGRNTMVYMSRSREDQSGGPARDIHAAGHVLYERLTAHAEFLDESFSSLSLLRDSTIELRENRVMAQA